GDTCVLAGSNGYRSRRLPAARGRVGSGRDRARGTRRDDGWRALAGSGGDRTTTVGAAARLPARAYRGRLRYRAIERLRSGTRPGIYGARARRSLEER